MASPALWSRPMLVSRHLTHRQARRIAILSQRWRRRILFVAGGLLVGGTAVGLAIAADLAGRAFDIVQTHRPHAALLLTPAGFALASLLSRRYFPGSGGSGIPQAIAARQMVSHGARARLVSLRLAAGKIALLLLGLLCGASIGREGPTVQVGASIMFAVGRL